MRLPNISPVKSATRKPADALKANPAKRVLSPTIRPRPARDQRTERTILPSQITGLPNLEGFLRTPEISSIVRVQIKHKEYAKKTNAFQPAV